MSAEKRVVAACLILSIPVLVCDAPAADWPTWRYDAERSAASPQELPAELRLQWVRQLPALKSAWSDPRVQFDRGYEPIVMGGTMFVGSSRNDSVTALDTETGRERWRFHADGPVRVAPVGWKGKVYVGSDDGYLYALDARSGALVWKFRGGPSERKVLGNGRLISVWPVRSGPAVADGKVYFAAGIWPMMGIFVYALDAETGKIVWKSDSGDPKWDIWGEEQGKTWERNNAFRGMAPNGYTVVVGDKVLIPSGRSGPACFDRKTGKFLYQKAGSRMRKGGGWFVSGAGDYFLNDTTVYDLSTGRAIARIGTARGTIVDGLRTLSSSGHYDISKVLTQEYDRKGEKRTRKHFAKISVKLEGGRAKMFWGRAGSHVLGSTESTVMALALGSGKPWTGEVEGTPSGMLAADGKLFVVTGEGSIYCFGAGKGSPKTFRPSVRPLPSKSDEWTQTAKDILERTGATDGYCLLLGVGTGRLAEELLRQSQLEIIGVDPDPGKIAALRKKLDAAGLYGTRIALHTGDPMRFGFPPYLANLIVSEDLKAAGFGSRRSFVKTVFRSLRPYGGVGCFSVPADKHAAFASWVNEARLAGAKLTSRDGLSLLVRSGPLPGAGQWTHHNADPANTLMSGDKLVRGPLGVLWFGGAGDALVAETRAGTDFYKPLTPRVAAGRMFIVGPGRLNAMDVYTGRVLWSVPVDNKRVYERRETKRNVQIRSSSRPLVALADAVYVVSGESLLKLSSETGKVDPRFKFDQKGEWSEIVAYKDTLLASTGERLYALDRGSGEIRWDRRATAPRRFSALAAGGDKIFCLESPPPEKKDSEKRRGKKPAPKCTIMAMDARTGMLVWSKPTGIAQSVIAYSEARDIVLLGSAAYQGKDGTLLRSGRAMGDPYIMRGDTLFTQHKKGYNNGRNAGALDLLTGKPKMAPHPITGTDILWYFARSHGCSRILGGQNILTFRSSTTAYYDLTTDGGVTQLVSFRPFCGSGSLVPADGVLNAPNLSACSCAYPIYTHMALIHDPEAENWSHYKVSNTPEVNHAYRDAPGYVRRVGLNFGAPGDRRAESGTLWLDYPSIGGWSFDIPVKTDPENPRWFRHHSSRVIEGNGPKWVHASGAEDLKSVTVTLKNDKPRTYTVRVYYAEPVGDEAGSLRGSLVEKSGVRAGRELTWEFDRGKMVCGIEVVEEALAAK